MKVEEERGQKPTWDARNAVVILIQKIYESLLESDTNQRLGGTLKHTKHLLTMTHRYFPNKQDALFLRKALRLAEAHYSAATKYRVGDLQLSYARSYRLEKVRNILDGVLWEIHDKVPWIFLPTKADDTVFTEEDFLRDSDL